MSLESRLVALASALGADYKTIKSGLIEDIMTLVSSTAKVTAITVEDDNTSQAAWPNRWEWLYKPFGGSAKLVQWVNEFGELRIVPAKFNTIGLVIFGRTASTDTAHSGYVLDIQNNRTDKVSKFGVDELGNVAASGNIATTANVTVGGTLTTSGAITRTVPSGPTLSTGYLVLALADSVPANTPAGTLIVRLPT